MTTNEPREQCAPRESDWYMEVIYGPKPGVDGDTDYAYGYYKGDKPTRPSDLVPEGFKILESKVRRTS